MFGVSQKINVRALKIIILDIGSSGQSETNLRAIAEFGDENVDYYKVQDMDLD